MMKIGESRVYVVPLRMDLKQVPIWRKTKRGVAALKAFILKHTKADSVKLSRWVNEAFWENGARHTLGKVKVKVSLVEEEIDEKTKEKIKVARVELDVLPARAKKFAEKETKKKTLRERIKAKFAKKEDTEVKEEKQEDKEKAKMTKEQELGMKK